MLKTDISISIQQYRLTTRNSCIIFQEIKYQSLFITGNIVIKKSYKEKINGFNIKSRI